MCNSCQNYVIVQIVLYIKRAYVGLVGGGGGVIPYMGHIGNCGLVGYGFSAVLVINRVSTQRILTILVISSVWFS